jgi:hypothetical protein
MAKRTAADPMERSSRLQGLERRQSGQRSLEGGQTLDDLSRVMS